MAVYNHIQLANSSPKLIQQVKLDGKRIQRGLGDRLSAVPNAALQNATFLGNDEFDAAGLWVAGT
ncbi:hypothetical protein V4C85_19060 [Ralstonia solanacearum]|uniref:hypothetical protein n=1 Tax=Ralstonia solanacearum TaxID=305 RepID=UPI000B07058E|nr:hypothetical protein [Ralstonia solanacearum]